MKKNLNLLYILLILTSYQLKAQNFQQTTINSGLPDLGYAEMVWADYDRDGDYDILLSGSDNLTHVICTLYNNNGDTTFTNSGIALPQVYQGDLLFSDFNNDNFPDLIISGKTDENLKITELYSNNADGSFTKIITDIDSVSNSSIVAADFNNDGKKDILIAGINNTNERICQILKNNGNNNFQKINVNIDGISDGSVKTADFNKDGKTDVLVFGLNNLNQRIGNIFLNEGNFNFSKQNNSLPGLAYASCAVGDYDSDGYIDFLVGGMNQSGEIISKIFKNNANGIFTDINAGLTGLYLGSVQFGDYDNDGDLDVLLCGFDNNTRHSLLYQNQGGNVFTQVSFAVEDMAQGELNFIDFDKDKNLDIAAAGYAASEGKTILYRNLTSILPENPDAPPETSYETSEDTITLRWKKGFDNQTPNIALTYQISVGTSKYSYDVISPASDISDGFSYIPVQGNCFTDTFAILNNLPEGKYFWQVQAIDNAFLPSSFSQPDSFIVCNSLNIGADTSICLNSVLHLSVGQGTDVVNWYSSSQGLLVSGNFDLNYTVLQTDTIWAELTNDLGCNKIDSIIVSPIALPQINLPADTAVCKGSLLNLHTGSEPDSVNWYSNEGLISADTFSLSIQIVVPDTIWAEVISEFNCINKDTIVADTLTLPYFSLGQDTAACYSDFIEFSLTGFDSVNWYSTSELLSANTENITRQILQNDTLICETFNTFRCAYTDTIISYMRALPVVNAGNDSTICFETSIILGGNPPASGGTPPYSFFWQSNTAVSDPEAEHPESYPSQNEQYILTVNDFYNCSNKDTIYITVNPPSITDIPDSYTICRTETVRLGGNPTATGSLFPYFYEWYPDSSLNAYNTANPVAYPENTTQYRLILSTYICKPDTFFVNVNVNPLPDVSAGEDIITGFEEPVTLHASGASEYEWVPDLYLDDNHSENPEATPEQTITYILTGTDEIGCSAIDSVTITVINDIYIPNLFSPNNDGKNDVFKVYGKGIDEISLQIFDKQGKTVFASDDKDEIMNKGWNGTYNGKLMPDDAYIWIIKGTFKDGSIINYKGNRGSIFLIK